MAIIRPYMKKTFTNLPPNSNPPAPKNAGRIVTSSDKVMIHGDLEIILPGGKRVRVVDLLDRLEALEQAYMEDKLLGKTE